MLATRFTRVYFWLFSLLSVLLPLFLPCLAHASTLNVPTQYGTIQAAINAAQNGDTVLVADGTYTGPGDVDIDFVGKNITVTSQNGPASTIIDCGGSASVSHRGFVMRSGEMNATISGFTVKNGYETYEAGDVTSGSGGGIYLGSNTDGSSLMVQNCIVTNCAVGSGEIGGSGGGFYIANHSNATPSAIMITNCTISNNTAVYYGGGITNGPAGSGKVTLTGCTITGNTAVLGGGGVENSTDNGTITLAACTIASNTGPVGGGVYNYITNGGTIAQNNCTFTGSVFL